MNQPIRRYLIAAGAASILLAGFGASAAGATQPASVATASQLSAAHLTTSQTVDTAAIVNTAATTLAATDFDREYADVIPEGYAYSGARFIIVESPPGDSPVPVSDLQQWRVVYNVAYSRPGGQDVWHSIAYEFDGEELVSRDYHTEAYGGGRVIDPPMMTLEAAYRAFDAQRVREGHKPGSQVYNAWFWSKLGPDCEPTGSWYFLAEDGGLYKISQ